MTVLEGQAVLTMERARIIKDAFDNWLKIEFHAGNNWQYYTLQHSVLRFCVEENYKTKVCWTYNVLDVEITKSGNSEFLTIRTDEGNILMFKIGKD